MMFTLRPIDEVFPFKDTCYGLVYLGDIRSFKIRSTLGPFSAPGNILHDLFKNETHQERWNTLIHSDIADCLPAERKITVLEHALGTWHIAEQCLQYGRIKLLKRPEDRPGPENISLAGRLTYGANDFDTLIEEFSLAAFFQAYSPGSTINRIADYLNNSEAFTQYQNPNGTSRKPIMLSVVTYWACAEHDASSALNAVSEEIDSMKQQGRECPDLGLVERARLYFFADTGPLNLRHLDLVGRIHSAVSRPAKIVNQMGMGDTLRKFLSRIVLAPRWKGDAHLLPDCYPWNELCPYYVPDENDDPTYRFLETYIEGLKWIKEHKTEESMSHSLCKSCAPEVEKRQRVGLLRLSLIDRRQTNASAKAFQDCMAYVTSC